MGGGAAAQGWLPHAPCTNTRRRRRPARRTRPGLRKRDAAPKRWRSNWRAFPLPQRVFSGVTADERTHLYDRPFLCEGRWLYWRACPAQPGYPTRGVPPAAVKASSVYLLTGGMAVWGHGSNKEKTISELTDRLGALRAALMEPKGDSGRASMSSRMALLEGDNTWLRNQVEELASQKRGEGQVSQQ